MKSPHTFEKFALFVLVDGEAALCAEGDTTATT
jgi:hypothetical protein